MAQRTPKKMTVSDEFIRNADRRATKASAKLGGGWSRQAIVVVQQSRYISLGRGSNPARAELGGLSVLAGTVPEAVIWERGADG